MNEADAIVNMNTDYPWCWAVYSLMPTDPAWKSPLGTDVKSEEISKSTCECKSTSQPGVIPDFLSGQLEILLERSSFLDRLILRKIDHS